jgi:hypothetical protein
MTPAKYNINIWRGAVKDLEFRFYLNLSGCTAKLFYKVNHTLLYYPLTITDITDVNSVEGVKWSAAYQLSNLETRALPVGSRIPYELQITTSGNKDYVYIEGELLVSGGNNLD